MNYLLSTAYFPPIQYFCKLYSAGTNPVYIEAWESISKQTYRNRCHILGANGIQALSIPLAHHDKSNNLITKIRLSDHGNWRHIHKQAIISSYGKSPFFEYYWDDIAPFFEREDLGLWEFNREILQTLIRLIDLDTELIPTTDFAPIGSIQEGDFRFCIHPKGANPDPDFVPHPYYQTLSKNGDFAPNLSILDLLFNMGPESILILQKCTQSLKK